MTVWMIYLMFLRLFGWMAPLARSSARSNYIDLKKVLALRMEIFVGGRGRTGYLGRAAIWCGHGVFTHSLIKIGALVR